MTVTFKKAALSLAVASTLTLVGCGGSSSSGSPANPPPPPAVSATTVSGAAVKGIMKNAVVRAFELDTQGKRSSSPVGTARTNSKGEYSVRLNAEYTGGLIDIEITSDANTRMVCDASSCDGIQRGDDVKLPDGFKLNAIVSKPRNGNEVSAPVTAWSTMAAKRAKAKASTSGDVASSLKEANFQVQQLVGFDPSKVAAKGVGDLAESSADEQQAAIMNAVVAELIFSEGGSGTSPATYLEKFDKFTGAIENDDSFGDEGDSFKLSDLAKATEKALAGVNVADTAAVSKVQGQQAVYEDPANEQGLASGTFDPDNLVDETASQEEKIVKFQKFVTDVRSWATSIEAVDTAKLGEVVNIEAIEAVFQDGPIASLKILQEVVNQSLDTVVIAPDDIDALLSGDTKTFPIKNGGAEIGQATLSASNDDSLQFRVVGDFTGEASTRYLPFDLTIQTNLPESAFDTGSKNLQRLLANTELIVDGRVENGSGLTLAGMSNVVASLELAADLARDESVGSVTDEQITEKFVGASLSGGLELNAYSEDGSKNAFTGTFSGRLTRLNDERLFVLNDTPISLRRLAVAGTFTSAEGEIFDASAALNINNASDFDTFAWLDYSEERRWVNTGIDGSGLLDLFGHEEGAEAVSRSVDLNVFNNDGLRSGHLWTTGYLADNEPKVLWVNYETQKGEELINAFASDVASAIPSLDLAYRPEGETNSQTLTVDLADIFASSSLGVDYSSQQNSAESELKISAPDVASQYPGIVAYAQIGSEYTPSGAEIIATLNENDGFSITIRGGDVDEAAAAVLNNALMIEGANWSRFDGDNRWGSVSASFSRPATKALYTQCVNDAPTELAKLGKSHLLDWQTSEVACADATLSVSSFKEDLDSAAIAAADGAVQAALSEKYGNTLANQLGFGYYYISASESGQSYIAAEVEFPDLESEASFIDASLTLSATARNIPDMPDAKVTVTANRNSFLGGQLFASMKWDEGQYWIEVESDNLEQPEAITARFHDAYERELRISASFDASGKVSGMSGDAFINGEDIGDVTIRNAMPVIIYPNGAETVFETLF